jgi:hypothetical protein
MLFDDFSMLNSLLAGFCSERLLLRITVSCDMTPCSRYTETLHLTTELRGVIPKRRYSLHRAIFLKTVNL